MAEIHQLIVAHGKAKAKEIVDYHGMPANRRQAFDIAVDVLEDDSSALSIVYSGWCVLALPHRRLADDAVWERKTQKASMVIEPGWLKDAKGELKRVGVPYGSRARLILLYLQTEALRTNSPEVELGRSMRDWLHRIKVPVGGKSYDDVREQANRISVSRLTFWFDDNKAFEKDDFVKGGIMLAAQDDERQGRLWSDTVRLSDSFFRALKSHPVPLWEPAIAHLSSRSMALDAYIWLAYRLHSLSKPTPVTWAGLHAQFGAGYADIPGFKRRFLENLEYVMAVYPDAKIEVRAKDLLLHPSRPPISEREMTKALSLTGS